MSGSGKIKVLIVFGTRPEAIKLFPLVHALEPDERFDVRICVTAQHRAMLDQVLSLANITPHHDLDLMMPNQTLDTLTAKALTGIGAVLDEEKPDWIVVQGDTTTAMTGALAAYYRQIRVCHVEAGLRSGDLYRPWPEEANRKIIGSFAALHCAPTQTAADALRAENINPETIFVTGNTVVDALEWVTAEIAQRPSLVHDLAGLAQKFAQRKIIAITTHRRENFGEGMAAIASAVKRIAIRDDVAFIFPIHMNPNVRQVMEAQLQGMDNVAIIEPLDYLHFAHLLGIAHIILTDSGGVQEEAPTLGKPVLVMRTTTERPEGIEAGTALLVGTDADEIVEQVEKLLDSPEDYRRMSKAHNPFGDGKAAQRICDLLASSR